MAAEAAQSCERCGGLGWVTEKDGGAGAARPCECALRQAVPRRIAAARIPTIYRHCTLEGFQVAAGGQRNGSLARALTVCREYVDNALADRGEGPNGLLLIGAPGVGKTHLAVATLLELLRRHRIRGRFVDFTALVQQIRASFDPASTDSSRALLAPVEEAHLLVLDDLGAARHTEWVNEMLYLVLNRRYTERLPTIFTTNYRLEPAPGVDEPAAEDPGRGGYDDSRPGLGTGAPGAGPGAVRPVEIDASPPLGGGRAEAADPDLLASRIPTRLVSRLHEMALPVVIEATDYRRRDRARVGRSGRSGS